MGFPGSEFSPSSSAKMLTKCLLQTNVKLLDAFVCGDYDKILMETGKFSGNIRVTENGLMSGVDRVL